MGPCQESLILFVVLLCHCCTGDVGNGTTALGQEPLSTSNSAKEPELADILTVVGHINSSIDINTTALEIHDRVLQDDGRLEIVNVTIVELNTTSDVAKVQLKDIPSSPKIFKNRTLPNDFSGSSFDASTEMQNNSYLINPGVITFEKQNSSVNITAIQMTFETDSFASEDFSKETLNATNIVKSQYVLNVTKIREKQEILHTLFTNENKKTLNITTIKPFEKQKTSTEDILQQSLNMTKVEDNLETENATKNNVNHEILNKLHTDEKQETSTAQLSVFGNETTEGKTHVVQYLNVTTSGDRSSNWSILLNATTASFQINPTTEPTKSAHKNVLREWMADTVPLPRHHDIVAMGNDPFESLVWKDKRYLISVLIPICIGVFGAVVIVIATYVARSCPRLPKPTQDIIQSTFSQSENISTRDNVLLLIDTSEDDM